MIRILLVALVIIQCQSFLHKIPTTLRFNIKTLTMTSSFITDELRPYAMKLHTREQAPREGQQKPDQTTTPVSTWAPGRKEYLHFLVDSLLVYQTFDEIVNNNDLYKTLRNTGLERAEALKKDILWMSTYDNTLIIPTTGTAGIEYATFLKEISKKNPPKFLCHFYNHYFAHTAGGRMIGKRMSDNLLNGHTLHFYQWEGEVKDLLDKTRIAIDTIAAGWNEVEKKECLEETMATFKYGGSLMSYMRGPGKTAAAH